MSVTNHLTGNDKVYISWKKEKCYSKYLLTMGLDTLICFGKDIKHLMVPLINKINTDHFPDFLIGFYLDWPG